LGVHLDLKCERRPKLRGLLGYNLAHTGVADDPAKERELIADVRGCSGSPEPGVAQFGVEVKLDAMS
jgi:hypothetical protein